MSDARILTTLALTPPSTPPSSVVSTLSTKPAMQGVVNNIGIMDNSGNSASISKATFKISMSERDQQIADGIDEISEVLSKIYHGGLAYEAAINYNFESEQQKLQAFLQDDLWKNKEAFWRDNIEVIDAKAIPNENELQKNRIVIARLVDDQNLPLGLYLNFKSDFGRNGREINIDLIDINRQMQLIKSHNLNYFNDQFVTELIDDADKLSEKLRTPDQWQSIHSSFTQKYEGKLSISLTLYCDKNSWKIKAEIKDKYDIITISYDKNLPNYKSLDKIKALIGEQIPLTIQYNGKIENYEKQISAAPKRP